MNRLSQFKEVKTIILEFNDQNMPAKFVRANVICRTNENDLIGDSEYVFCLIEEGKEDFIVDACKEDSLKSITVDNVTIGIPFSQWVPCS